MQGSVPLIGTAGGNLWWVLCVRLVIILKIIRDKRITWDGFESDLLSDLLILMSGEVSNKDRRHFIIINHQWRLC